MSDMSLPLDESRYERIMEDSQSPVLGLFKESVKEDRYLVLPRMILASFLTFLRIPRSILAKRGPRGERYVFETLTRWARKVCRIGQIRLEVRGAEYIDPAGTYLFTVNHSSPADIPVLYATLPVRAGFVANGILSSIPVFSYWMRMSGAVFVKPDRRKADFSTFRLMVKRLRKGRSLVVFPEGHMYQGEGLAEFKRGGIRSALLAGVPIVPVCLKGTDQVMRTGSLRIARRRSVLVEYGKPVDVGNLGCEDRRNIEGLVRERMIAMKGRSRSGG